MKMIKNDEIAALMEQLTDVRFDPNDKSVKGRNIWGRAAFRRAGMVHVEIMPGDEQVNDAVMRSISAEDMELSGVERQKIYRNRCRVIAAESNARAINDNGLVLLLSSNGHLTKRAKALIEALL